MSALPGKDRGNLFSRNGLRPIWAWRICSFYYNGRFPFVNIPMKRARGLRKSLDKSRTYAKFQVFPDGVGARYGQRVGFGEGPFKEKS
jgi:hypothetical protein